MGGASAPTLFCRVARNCMATWAKSVGAEAPPTTAASHNSRLPQQPPPTTAASHNSRLPQQPPPTTAGSHNSRLRQGSPAGLTPSRARS
ncbi:DUF6053 domain-containing protein [Lysobacter yananisis]|uniref:DUF6053 domain-containing protein n=1 Tax=Lysobacter yananisis TaxID=1003114 RepID=UPI003CE4DB17